MPRSHRTQPGRTPAVALIVALSVAVLACGSEPTGTAVASAGEETTTTDGAGSTGEADGGAPSGEDAEGQDEVTTTSPVDAQDDAVGSTTVDDSESKEDTTTSEAPMKIETKPLELSDLVISKDGIGPVKAGADYLEMVEALGPGFDITPEDDILVDVSGWKVARNGETLFYAVDDGLGLNVLITDNPNLALESGLRPGTTLADAVALHGEPTLSYNVNNESREFVVFADGMGSPASGLTLQTLVEAGIYPEPLEEFNQTNDYRPEGKIGRIWVINR